MAGPAGVTIPGAPPPSSGRNPRRENQNQNQTHVHVLHELGQELGILGGLLEACHAGVNVVKGVLLGVLPPGLGGLDGGGGEEEAGGEDGTEELHFGVVVREGGSMGTWKVKVGGRRDWGFFSEKARGTLKGGGGVGRLQRRDFNLAPD